MFIIKEEIKESIRKLRRAWSCCWLINPLVYGNISRAGGQLEEERIKIFLESGDLLLQFNVNACPNQHLFGEIKDHSGIISFSMNFPCHLNY